MPNTEALSKCKCRMRGIAMLIQAQLRWSGHFACMPDHRIPVSWLMTSITSQLTVQDLWDNPAAVADFLNLDN